MKTANEAMGEILGEKDLNITELNHLICAAATVVKEEVNGMAEYRPVFLNRRAAARYRDLASIIPGRERFSWNLLF